METPSSTRRVTRSQTKAAAAASVTTINTIPISKRFEESEKKGNGKQKERSALFDITNDSPIIGLAMVTPSSGVSKKRVIIGQITPGSGEALLRGQVKNLLQKVEEEADDFCKVSLDHNNRPLLHLQGFVNSPLRLLAPTPANTPHLNPSENGLPSVTPSPVEETIIISQMIIGKKESETEESNVTRSLLLDFSEKSTDDVSSDCSSMLTYEGDIRGSKNAGDDDVSSVWSIQANASTVDDDEEEEDECVEEVEEECDDEEVEGEDDDGGLVEELCRGISKIGINAKFAGKHTRFVYNSDGELEGEEEEDESAGGDGAVAAASPLRLKGLPTPKGKHLRFPEEEN